MKNAGDECSEEYGAWKWTYSIIAYTHWEGTIELGLDNFHIWSQGVGSPHWYI